MRKGLEYAVKSVIRGLARLLPVIVQVEFFKTLARLLDVSAVVVQGRCGRFEGGADDFLMGFYIRNRVWSPVLLELITKKMFSKGIGTYLDIGANIGMTAIPIANAGDISVHCFEPEPRNLSFLKRNIEMNAQDRNIVLHDCALFSQNGSLELEISPENRGDHRIRNQGPPVQGKLGEEHRETISVGARTLDSILLADTLRKPIVAKIDVQGSEVDVFRGGRRIFSEIDYMVLEFWPYGLLRMGAEISEFYEILTEFDYGAILYTDGDSLPELRPVRSIIDELNLDTEFIEGKNVAQYHDVILSRVPAFSAL